MTLVVTLLLFLKVVIKYAYRSLVVCTTGYPNASCHVNSCCKLFEAVANLSESEIEDNMDVIRESKEKRDELEQEKKEGVHEPAKE